MPSISSNTDTKNGSIGLLPWLMWSLGAAFYFFAFFHRVTPSVMVGELMQDLKLSAAALGNMSALYFWGYGLAQLPTGALADRWGPRKLLTVAVVVCGLSSLVFALSESALIAYFSRFFVGFGAGFGFVTTLKIVAEWFPTKRFALLSGLTLMIGTLGGIAGQAPLANAVAAFGWRHSIIGGSLVTIFLGMAIWIIVREPPSSKNKINDFPHPFHSIAQVLRQPQTWIIIVAGFSSVGTLFAFGALWGIPYLMEVYQLPRANAAFSASLMLVGWGVGAPLIGWASDHFRTRKLPFIISSAAAFISISLLLYGPDLSIWMVNALLFINGGSSAGVVIAFAAIREHNEEHAAGTAMALLNMGVILSGAALQPLIGWLLDRNWEGGFAAGRKLYSATAYDAVLWVLPCFAGLALVLAMIMRDSYGRKSDH